MNGYFISHSGTRHTIGSAESKLHGGRIVALCGFSQRPDEEPPVGEGQPCGWCLEAEERAQRIARAQLEAAGQPATDPEAA